ncbi:hypothetical protein C8R45DRAFT_1081228 [Mycena sanguinolenta]|nr:hypothetical protein C8R45DRAFT_1081228 [Mycena sanguinolenta]
MEDIQFSASRSDPHLPPELERVIFEMAALTRRRTIPQLMLVASRVKVWTEPLLYQVIMLSVPAFKERDSESLGLPYFNVEILLKAIERKSPLFFQNAVQHLFLQNSMLPKELEIVCAACTRVVNLFHFNTGLHDLGVLRSLHHLRRLSLSFPVFLHFCRSDDTRTVLDNLTHLELYAGPFKKLTECLPLLPHLTHISLSSIPDYEPLQAALSENAHLQCITVLSEEWDEQLDLTACGKLIGDPRFVYVLKETPFRVDWFHGADVGKSHWAIADAFLGARRDGKVDRYRRIVSDTDPDLGS